MTALSADISLKLSLKPAFAECDVQKEQLETFKSIINDYLGEDGTIALMIGATDVDLTWVVALQLNDILKTMAAALQEANTNKSSKSETNNIFKMSRAHTVWLWGSPNGFISYSNTISCHPKIYYSFYECEETTAHRLTNILGKSSFTPQSIISMRNQLISKESKIDVFIDCLEKTSMSDFTQSLIAMTCLKINRWCCIRLCQQNSLQNMYIHLLARASQKAFIMVVDTIYFIVLFSPKISNDLLSKMQDNMCLTKEYLQDATVSNHLKLIADAQKQVWIERFDELLAATPTVEGDPFLGLA